MKNKKQTDKVMNNVASYFRVGNQNQLETITVTEAGKMLNLQKEEMKEYVDKNSLTKIGNDMSKFRYVLSATEINNILSKKKDLTI